MGPSLFAIFAVLFASTAHPGERALNEALAKKLGGEVEVRYDYFVGGKKYFIRVDIETDEYAIEAGLDKRSSLDSIQQAVFAAILSGKKPKVIIYDTDGLEGRFEYRIRRSAERLGIIYERVAIFVRSSSWPQARQMTRGQDPFTARR